MGQKSPVRGSSVKLRNIFFSFFYALSCGQGQTCSDELTVVRRDILGKLVTRGGIYRGESGSDSLLEK